MVLVAMVETTKKKRTTSFKASHIFEFTCEHADIVAGTVQLAHTKTYEPLSGLKYTWAYFVLLWNA